jgi:hypothetical protein
MTRAQKSPVLKSWMALAEPSRVIIM